METTKTNMDQGARLWIIKTARANLWRVSGHIDLDDLVQDGMYFWVRIVTRYPNVTHPPHRMALFKTAFTNHIHDLSKSKSRLDVVNESDLGVDMDVIIEGDDPSQDPDLAFLISQLPPAIMRVFTRMYYGDAPFRHRLDGTRETCNQRACRIAGLDPTLRDVQTAVLQYLGGSKLHPQYD